MLEAAERWGIAPWRIMEEAPDIWMERLGMWTTARNERNSPRPPVGEVRQVGNKRVKRVI